MSNKTKLSTEYVANLETQNNLLEEQNFKLTKELEKVSKQYKSLQLICDEFSSCLNQLLEEYKGDSGVSGPITKTMNMVATRMLKENKR